MNKHLLTGALAMAFLCSPVRAEKNIFDFGNENDPPKTNNPPPAAPGTPPVEQPDPTPGPESVTTQPAGKQPGSNSGPVRPPTRVRVTNGGATNPPPVTVVPPARSIDVPIRPSGPVLAGPAKPGTGASAQMWANYYIQRADANVGQMGSPYQQASATSMLARIQLAVGDNAGAKQSYAAQVKRFPPEMAAAKTPIVVETLAMSGDLDGAQNALPEPQAPRNPGTPAIVTNYERDRGLAWIARARADAGDYSGALGLFSQNTGLSTTRTPVYSYVLTRCTEKGGVAAAKALIAGMPDARRADELRRMLVITLAKSGDIAGAKAVLKEINSPVSRDGARSSIIGQQAAAKDLAGARATLAELETPSYQESAIARIASEQQRAGDFKGAVATIKMIEQPARQSSQLLAIAEAQVIAKDAPAAILATLKDADADDKPRGQAVLARVKAMQGDIPGGIKIAAAIPHTEKKHEPARASALTAIAVIQAEKGDIAGAKKTADQVQLLPSDSSVRDYALRQVLVVQATHGDLAGALQAIDTLPESSRLTARGMIIQAQIKAGNFTGAHQLLASMPSKVAYCRQMASQQIQSQDAKTRGDLVAWIDGLQTPEELIAACAGAAEGLLQLKREQTYWPSFAGLQ